MNAIKNIVIILLITLFSVNVVAQVKSNPKSRAGATIGLCMPEDKYDNGINGNIFFHQTISRLLFISFDASYCYYTCNNKEYILTTAD